MLQRIFIVFESNFHFCNLCKFTHSYIEFFCNFLFCLKLYLLEIALYWPSDLIVCCLIAFIVLPQGILRNFRVSELSTVFHSNDFAFGSTGDYSNF